MSSVLLRDLKLNYVYDSSEVSIVNELFIPLLSQSKIYQRGVGYFTSGWLKMNMKGILKLVEKKGKAQIITSPYLNERDLKALQTGEAARKDEILYQKLKDEIEYLDESSEVETLTLLSWLVADGLLDLKFAIPKNNMGDFHDKFAIFEDESGDKVAFHGSYNDSIRANYNGESFSVYCSWIKGQAPYVEVHERRFRKLYQGQNDFFNIYKLPDMVKSRLIEVTKYTERPYEIHKTAAKPIEEASKIRIPSFIDLHDYQKEAIQKWLENDKKGLYAMATGTGKTITSLSASVEVYKERKKIFLIISVPFKHLVEQWKDEAKLFGYQPIVSLGSSQKWFREMKALVDDFNLELEDVGCFIITHQSNADEEKFLKLISKVKEKSNILYIGDEAHYLGAQYLRKSLHPEINMRIGLTATPERWRDASGTKVVREYFSTEVINFGLEKAIKEGFLTPYDFYPQFVELGQDEYKEYKKLTVEIGKWIKAAKKDPSKQERVERLSNRRANILNKSDNKINAFLALMKKHIQEIGIENFKHTIVYCPEGKHREILRLVANLGLRVQEIIGETSSSNRKDVLKAFDKGEIQVIVAMKCLDEGVNVPATKRAYFLASTSNPRQFVQRRGRILRKSVGKKKAYIYDFVMIPPKSYEDNENTQKRMLKKEFARYIEFYLCAENQLDIHEEAYSLLERFDLTYLLSLKPEEIHATLGGDLDE